MAEVTIPTTDSGAAEARRGGRPAPIMEREYDRPAALDHPRAPRRPRGIPYFEKYFVEHELPDLTVIKKKLTRHAHEVYAGKVKQVLLVNVFSAGGEPPFKGAHYDPD